MQAGKPGGAPAAAAGAAQRPHKAHLTHSHKHTTNIYIYI